MNPHDVQFLATPSATLHNAWIGLVTARRTGAIYLRTIVAYRRADEARFGARRAWVTSQRLLDLLARDSGTF